MKNISIEREGIIKHIDAYFISRGSDWRFPDVMRLSTMRIGKRRLSLRQQADELGVSRQTLDKWHKHLPKV